MIYAGSTDKETIFKETESYIADLNLRIVSKDSQRPWGGFLVIDEKDADAFIKSFFPTFNADQLAFADDKNGKAGKLSPKILIVAPGKRLSWQYHHRRAEIWTLIDGEAAVATSDTDEESKTISLEKGKHLELKQGERHRLIGLDNWGILAEIWRHTDPTNPSNEDDIVRVQDDFGR